MSNLKMVVSELQEQNKSLNDVKEGIKAMLEESMANRERYEREAGDREEERRESKKKERISKSTKAPTSFAAGFGQGTGLAGLSASIGDMVPSFLTGAGLLGGATLGGVIGKGIGRLFFPALGAFFGVRYLDKWVDPLVDKITGDDATWTMFGKEFDASKIVSGFAGALAVIFAKDALIQTAKGLLGVGDDTKVGNMRKLFIRRLGLTAVIGIVGDALGDKIGELVGSKDVGEAISTSAQWAAVGMMFGPKGAIILGIAGLVYSAAKFALNYFDKQRENLKTDLEKQINQDIAEAAAAADIKVKEAKLKSALANAAALYSPMDESTRLDPAQRGAIKEQMEYIRGVDAAAFRRLEALSAPMMVDRGLSADPQPIWDAAFSRALTILGVSRPDLLARTNEEQLKAFLANSPTLEGYRSIDGFYEYLDSFIAGKAKQVMKDLVPGINPFGDNTNLTMPEAQKVIDQNESGLKPISPYAQYASTRMNAPSTPVQRGSELIEKIATSGGTYTPGIDPQKLKGVPGFSVADMFGSGNSFTNGPQPSNAGITTVDASTNVSNFAAKNTYVSQQAPVSYDKVEAYLGKVN